MSPQVSRGFSATLEVLKPDMTWIVAPVPEAYPLRLGAIVTNIKGVLHDLAVMAAVAHG
jgi:hypothetical protein